MARRRRLTDWHRSRVLSDYSQHRLLQSAARAGYCSASSAKTILCGAGVYRPKLMRRLTAWHRSRILANYGRTSRVTAAAKSAGVSTNVARRVIQDAGVFRRAVPQYPASLRSRALAMYTDPDRPESCYTIAKHFLKIGSHTPTAETIWQWIRHAGVGRTRSEADRAMNQRRTGKNYGELERRALYLAREKRWSANRIANYLFIGGSTSRRWLKKAGLLQSPTEVQRILAWRADLPQVRARLRRRATVIQMRIRGRSYAEISEEVGISSKTIGKWLRAAGMVETQSRPIRVAADGVVKTAAPWPEELLS